MKTIFSFLSLLMSLNGLVFAQASKADNAVIAEGKTAKLSLQTQLSSKLSEVGDEVRAVLQEAAPRPDGLSAEEGGADCQGENAWEISGDDARP